MKKVLFVDIDGVLNSRNSLRRNNEDRLFYGRISNLSDELRVKWHLSYLDFDNIQLLKHISSVTGCELVITSAWKDLTDCPLIEEALVQKGFPIVGCINSDYGRGIGIKSYLMDYDIKEYAILDDEVFADYDEELIAHLFKSDNYNGGLNEEIAYEIIGFLGEKRFKTLGLKSV